MKSKIVAEAFESSYVKQPTALEQPREQTGHTPTPWFVDENWMERYDRVCGQSGIGICEVNRTDAKFIVRAVNSHEALLEACEFFLAAITDGDIVRDISKDASPEWAPKMMKFVSELQKAEVAVAKAEGK